MSDAVSLYVSDAWKLEKPANFVVPSHEIRMLEGLMLPWITPME
jgi:hypothetical protein